ncbi:deoxyribose-phosphate aldolase [Flavitalea flava]
MTSIASYIDHTILKPTTSAEEISQICGEALECGFAAVCIPPPMVRQAVEMISDTRKKAAENGNGSHQLVKVATVIGFPFGYSCVKAKLEEVEQAIADGADELDIVINLIALQKKEWEFLEWEMQSLTDRVHTYGKTIKVIIETGILPEAAIIRCCEIYSKIGVDFLKTSTGYAEKGATLETVRLMRQHLPPSISIKASGGIRQYAFARQLIEAGADRLGCSASLEILRGEKAAQAGSDDHDRSAKENKGKPRTKDINWEVGGEG